MKKEMIWLVTAAILLLAPACAKTVEVGQPETGSGATNTAPNGTTTATTNGPTNGTTNNTTPSCDTDHQIQLTFFQPNVQTDSGAQQTWGSHDRVLSKCGSASD